MEIKKKEDFLNLTIDEAASIAFDKFGYPKLWIQLRNILYDAGINTLKVLCTKEKHELLELKGLGLSRIKQIEFILDHFGLALVDNTVYVTEADRILGKTLYLLSELIRKLRSGHLTLEHLQKFLWKQNPFDN